MRVIVNATPLIALAAIGRLHLLQDLFGEVIIPQAIYREVVVAGASKPDADTWATAHWLRIMTPDQEAAFDALLLGLDAGEMEVLSTVIVGFLSKEQALSDLQSLLDQGIRISPRWQAWFRSEVGAAE